MKIKFPFDQGSSPPMPVLIITLRNEHEGLSTRPLEALVDTGADGTVVPEAYLKDIRSPIVGRARLRSHLGVRDVVLRIADVQIAELDTLKDVMEWNGGGAVLDLSDLFQELLEEAVDGLPLH